MNTSILHKLSKLNGKKIEEQLISYAKTQIIKIKNAQTNSDVLIELKLLQGYCHRVPDESIDMINMVFESKDEIIQKNNNTDKNNGINYEALVLEGIKILDMLKYIKLEEVFALFLKILAKEKPDIKYLGSYLMFIDHVAKNSESIIKHALDTLSSLASYNLHALKVNNYAVQIRLIEIIKSFSDEKIIEKKVGVLRILKELLSPIYSGDYVKGDTYNFVKGSLGINKDLENIREKTLELLFKIYEMANDDKERQAIIPIILTATRLPEYQNVKYAEDLTDLIIANTNKVHKFFIKIIPTSNLLIINDIAREISYTKIRDNTKELKNIPEIEKLIKENNDFDMYKTLVGSYFDDAGDENLSYEKLTKRRKEKIDKLVAEISDKNYDEWKEKLVSIANEHGKNNNNYEYFNQFLMRLGKEKPDIALRFINNDVFSNENFMMFLVAGILKSEQKEVAKKLLKNWLNQGKYLSLSTYIFAVTRDIDLEIFNLSLDKAIKLKHSQGLLNTIRTIATNEESTKKHNEQFFQAIQELTKLKNSQWIDYLYSTRICIRSKNDIKLIFDNLLYAPEISYHVEPIVAYFAKDYTSLVIDWLKSRVIYEEELKREDKNVRYEAIPYTLRDLSEVLHKKQETIIPQFFKWLKEDSFKLKFQACRLLGIYEFNLLEGEIIKLLETKKDEDIKLVRFILYQLQGSFYFSNKAIQMIIENDEYSELQDIIYGLMTSTGGRMVSGYDGFVIDKKKKKEHTEKWLVENKASVSDKVRDFVESHLKFLDKDIKSEIERAEERKELNKI